MGPPRILPFTITGFVTSVLGPVFPMTITLLGALGFVCWGFVLGSDDDDDDDNDNDDGRGAPLGATLGGGGFEKV